MSEVHEEIPPLDLASALRRAMGDKDFLVMLLKQFASTVPAQMTALKDAVSVKDGASIQKKAHQLKGAASNLSIEGLAETAFCLEKMGEEKDLAKAMEAMEDLEAEFDRLQHFVETFDWSRLS